MQKFIFYISQR